MPSPKGTGIWKDYIEHRLRVMNDGIEAYTDKRYARLGLDKHIESVRAVDKVADTIHLGERSLICLGASGSTPANSPIKIKKYMRCPGVRKLIAAFKKRDNCIIRMVDEYMTSQHCALCFKQFPQATRSHRFKNCYNCIPHQILHDLRLLPSVIVTKVSKRVLQMRRTIERTWREMREMGDAVAATLQDAPNTQRLVSKKQRFFKTWLPNVVVINEYIEEATEIKPRTTVWHRDIVAAKLILYKGMY